MAQQPGGTVWSTPCDIDDMGCHVRSCPEMVVFQHHFVTAKTPLVWHQGYLPGLSG